MTIQLDAGHCRSLLQPRPSDAHKGTFGTLVCVCGSLEYAGAALLSGVAALRAGAGLVGIAVPASLQAVVAARVPELITLGLPESGSDIDAAHAGDVVEKRAADAIVFGSGIRESDGYRELLLGMLRRAGPPLVVDGGGLNLLAAVDGWWSGIARDVVLTPHPGEFGRLTGSPIETGDAERLAAARAAAERFGCVVVLKGARSVVCEPGGPSAVSSVANAALATAGSGDVLGGLIGALIAQGATAFDAACLGVYLHARSGQRLAALMGDSGVLAGDIAAEIPHARHELGGAT